LEEQEHTRLQWHLLPVVLEGGWRAGVAVVCALHGAVATRRTWETCAVHCGGVKAEGAGQALGGLELMSRVARRRHLTPLLVFVPALVLVFTLMLALKLTRG